MESTISATTSIEKSESFLLYNLKIYLIKPFIGGILGFFIALATLAITYFIVTEFFKTGYFKLGSIEYIIAFIIGFVPLSIYLTPKQVEPEED